MNTGVPSAYVDDSIRDLSGVARDDRLGDTGVAPLGSIAPHPTRSLSVLPSASGLEAACVRGSPGGTGMDAVDSYNHGMRRIGYLVGALLVFAGVFWSGRESSHGLSALFEHWWCPIPIVAIVVGLVTAWLFARRPSHAP